MGTGFNPELTGRENIYLNGAILGMRKKEIKEKFNQIVKFSGVGKFLDTPVKHYSSGMYVRLAFAVAAHLESEILLIDEVLAVGDIEFQKKCLGKINNLAQSGRTVIFVSHNMGQIEKLCKKTILLDGGKIQHIGESKDIVNKYISSNRTLVSSKKNKQKNILNSDSVILKSYSIYGKKINSLPKTGQPLNIELFFKFKKSIDNPAARIYLRNLQGANLIYLNSTPLGNTAIDKGEGVICFKLTINELLLTGGQYVLVVGMNRSSMEDYLVPTEVCEFEVLPDDYYSVGIHLLNTKVGAMVAKHEWSLKKQSKK